MTFSSWCLVAVGVVTLAGCGATVHPVTGGDASASTDVVNTDAVILPDAPLDVQPTQRVCTRTSDCRAGEECLGGAGCGVPWVCGPALGRPCTDDIAQFCGCDGVTFGASSTCPGRPYAFRGACEEPPPPQDAGPGVCRLPDGTFCPEGRSCAFGCQLCTCRGGVTQCLDSPACFDAGPGACTLPNGTVCPLGAVCPYECNTCRCSERGLDCTLIGCFDGGPPPVGCRSSADCGFAQMCAGAPGCGTPWTCQPTRGCTADIATFCGCDGVTFTGSSSCPNRPYAHTGACSGPGDAGPAGCRLSNGTLCPVGETCAVDACVTCTCNRDGSVLCASSTGCVADAGPARDVTGPDATARRCSSPADCAAGELCQGTAGCGTAWVCAPSPTCTRDLVEYCGCDGRTFSGSSTCPGRPFATRGPCAPTPVSCRAQSAAGVGTCERFLGWAWNGATCLPLGGCSCTGTDCSALYSSSDACLTAHASCPRDAGVIGADI